MLFRPEILDQFRAKAIEAETNEVGAIERRNQRQARYWLTGLAIKSRAAKLREYIGKITEADIKFLRHDPNIGEAVDDLLKLAGELEAFAAALNVDPEELALLAKARGEVA